VRKPFCARKPCCVPTKMQFFGRRAPSHNEVYREVLFDQALSYLRLVPGEEAVVEMVRFTSCCGVAPLH
jgi:hypothetical protein